MNGISLGFWASRSCWEELPQQRDAVLGVEVRQLLAHDDQRQPEVAGAAGEVVGVLAGLGRG